ncbi:MAG: hypothetical protein A3D24_05130 [Candidatus Blackburnbacteria bacterium RIFCSPHIGHO2_02_FULL_39_13]|uniref:Glycosyltransferase RgtA/B/C/D-like domain-containing protein n=1 Tax=Candidatus Blackburnbacteria bacterium RIFCSPLOWO2_01_FULL_40_20 TaxID=1797519 RepID=A0A1G1VC93_9BACT|nr:MAG: hypothetical protein A3D24_05130 [Candidatus Blackburnbacteria bacterium RIFCSPHIGHO2_02_FULL_39_13]OGY12852.1 MAG: hypothetical protein A3A77_03085 [Candidatus Blackburnbacteria bacterium RIFCSPLOWO2_01_FULL_40_20]
MQISSKAFGYLSLAFVFLLFFLPPIDTDLGWHLRYGEYFLSTGTFLKQNTLTYFLPDYIWMDSRSLYQVLLAVTYKYSGLLGLSVIYGSLGVSIYWIFSKINSQIPKINILVFTITILASWVVFGLGIRTQIFTFAGILAVFYLAKISEKNPKILILLPLLFIFWANLHGGFVLGLAVCGIVFLQRLANRKWRKAIYLAIAGFFSALSALINPYGVGVYEDAIRYTQYPLWTLIAEWVPPNLDTKILLVVVALITVASTLRYSKRRVTFALCVILFFILAMQARRSIPFFVLASVLTLSDSYIERLKLLEKNIYFQKAISLLLISGIILLALIQVPNTFSFDTNWKNYCSSGMQRYPCRAIEYIKSHPIDGENVYAPYEWGGFLEWQLPEYKFFVDGRMPAWPTPDNKSPYTTYLEIVQAQPGYQQKLLSYGTDWLLLGPGTFLDIELQSKRGEYWKEIYRDEAAVIYVKK